MINKNTVITIGRQFGSGGHEIGRTLADKLGIPFYDSELITKAAKLSGIMESNITQFDEKVPESRWLPHWFTPFHSTCETIGQKIFTAQFEAIRHIAQCGGAVIVGRCADYVLRDNPNHVSAFILADANVRIKRIESRNSGIGDKAESLMRRADKARAWYYSFYTGKTWGLAESYDICLRSDVIAFDKLADIIIAYANAKI